PELSAQEPLADRAGSRLLMVLRSDRRIGMAPDRRAADRPMRGFGRRVAGSPGMPAGERHSVGGGVLADTGFAQLASLVPAGDLVVLNTTRVRHARLLGTRPSGAPAEVLLIHPAAEGGWIALGKPGSAMQPGKRIALGGDVSLETLEGLGDGHR